MYHNHISFLFSFYLHGGGICFSDALAEASVHPSFGPRWTPTLDATPLVVAAMTSWASPYSSTGMLSVVY